jgi:hypothetical protein
LYWDTGQQPIRIEVEELTPVFLLVNIDRDARAVG